MNSWLLSQICILRKLKVGWISTSSAVLTPSNYLSLLIDWWTHKIWSPWIIPCILQSQSKILPEHWSITPAMTNMGEAQHHWTNKQSGIKLPLVEAILSQV